MPTPTSELRSPQRQSRDEQVAAEPPLPPPSLPADASAVPVEAHFAAPRRPLAMAGVVENGLVRPLDPDVKLPERSRVIIVAAED
ncbi:MAG: hypothetical protein M3552_08850 [Planctomycetota bacterium]|nr:hypothetical protein [Planctomycetaceae bacterium]MDQ3330749.1 hypothetical protein [Planctomycetota bacterium]